jgi:hypothetical protein
MMTKILTAVVLTIAVMTASAQIQITGSDMPQPGTVNIVQVDTSSTPDLGVAGSAPQVWDYTSLLSQYPQVGSYSPVTPYQAYAPAFPGSNTFTYGPSVLYAGFYGGAPVDYNTWGYMFWKTGTDGFSVVGFRVDYGIGERNILESPGELLMGTPASLDSSFTNSSRWIASFNNNPFDQDTHYISNVYKKLDCDAYGTMTTSFGTFNVLRVHEYMITVDTLSATLGSITYYSTEVYRDTVNNYYFWAKDIGYPIAIVKADAHNNILRTEHLTDTMAGRTITGTVYKKNGSTPIESGKVELIAKSAIDHLYGVPETVPLTAGGHFQFSNVISDGNFLVHAEPDTTVYPYDIPTYYGDSVYWSSAATLTVFSDTVITIRCASDSLYYMNTGNGNIAGTIWQDLAGAKNLITAGGVKVTLEENPSGATARHTYTDENGKYAFHDVPPLNYRIRVDIAAVTMDSTYYIYYNAGDTNTANLDFYYDSLYIYIYNTSGIETLDPVETMNTVIYPNPFSDYSYLYFTNALPNQDYEFYLYDLTGREVNHISGQTPLPVRIDRPSSGAGAYFYTLISNGIRQSSGKLIVY